MGDTMNDGQLMLDAGATNAPARDCSSHRSLLPSPVMARRLADRLDTHRAALQSAHEQQVSQRQEFLDYMAVTDEIKQALDSFNDELFKELIAALQSQLTRALHEVLDQPLALKVERRGLRGSATLAFYVERAGQREHIMSGQGGSVVNVLSIGLRLLALSAVDEASHRRFLILDEQDCWLKPDLVPRLVQIVHDAAHRMGFQVLMISHHDPAMFEHFADRILRSVVKCDENGPYMSLERREAGGA